MNPLLHPVNVYRIFIEAEDAVGDSKFQKLDYFFSLGVFQTLVKLVKVEVLVLITCSATGTVMLVKRALASHETKVSSSGFIKRCLIFWMKSVLSLTKE